MTIDATFWVAVSFVLFIGLLIYFKIPQKVNEILNQLISNIKNEIDESEKLRNEAKTLLDNSQSKLDSASEETNKIIEQAKKDSENLIIEINEKFHKSAEIKKKSPEKINKIAIETSVDLIKQIIGTEVNNSSISAIVDDLSKKSGDKYYDN